MSSENQTIESDGDDGSTVASGASGALGPATWTRALILALALAVLGGIIGWTVADRSNRADAELAEVDVGFMRDMYAHHSQAVQMSLILLYKEDVPGDIKRYGEEILSSQRFEQGIYNAILTRAGEDTVDPDGMSMAWMGPEIPVDEMPGMATEEQMTALEEANGDDAQALFIGLMNEHHLGGIHMANHAMLNGDDVLVRRLAESSLKVQRAEVFELERYRERSELPLVEGFGPGTEDPRYNPTGLQREGVDG